MADDVGIKDGSNVTVTIAAKDIAGVLHPIHLVGDSVTGEPLDTSVPSEVVGNIAHSAPDSGNPVKVGGVYYGAGVTLANGDRGDLGLSSTGDLLVTPLGGLASPADGVSNTSITATHRTSAGTSVTALRSLPMLFNGASWDRQRGNVAGALVIEPEGWAYAAASGGIDNSSTAVTIKAAAAAGIKNHITRIQIAHATLGAATELAIRNGAGGTVLWRTLLHTAALPLTTVDVHLVGTAATLLEVVTLTAVTGDVLVNVQGYEAP